jgi:hypothetical protein
VGYTLHYGTTELSQSKSLELSIGRKAEELGREGGKKDRVGEKKGEKEIRKERENKKEDI